MKWNNFFNRFSLSVKFMLASLFVLVLSMLGLGWWVGLQIENGVVNRIAAETALYVDSFVDPPLQDIDKGKELSPEHIEILKNLVQQTPLGQHIVAFKLWDLKGQVIYSTNPALIGRVFPLKDDLLRSMDGYVVSDISDLTDDENFFERDKWNRLLEIYSPINREGTNQVIAVVEFYQTVDTLDKDVRDAQQRSWVVLGCAFTLIYLVLAVFVEQISKTLNRQREELKIQVDRLTDLLSQNQELSERVSRASSQSAMINERFLRRISAELHDGPAQDLGYSLIRLDSVMDKAEAHAKLTPELPSGSGELEEIQSSLQRAIKEIRAISSGLGLPELDALSLSETLERVVRSHEHRTHTRVKLDYADFGLTASLSTKITLYRLVQEALNNSFRHAHGVGQQVKARCADEVVYVEVNDSGPGFVSSRMNDQDSHLGLSGIRERVKSMGGYFKIDSTLGQGTCISATIPLQSGEIEA